MQKLFVKGYEMYRLTVILMLFILGCASASLTDKNIEGDLEAVGPIGWSQGGTSGMISDAFELYVDRTNKLSGLQSVVLLSTSADSKDMGTLHQTIAADSFVGKRVRFSGYIKTNMVSEWTGIWLRIDSHSRQAIAFDNMIDRPVKGTTEWTRYEVVLNVPESAAMMMFGLLMFGTGQVWLDDCKLEIVGDDVPRTGNWMSPFDKKTPVPMGLRAYPMNMGFED